MRQRDIDVRQKHRLAAFSYAPQPGIEPTTWARALTKNQTHNLQSTEQRSKQLSHTGQGLP